MHDNEKKNNAKILGGVPACLLNLPMHDLIQFVAFRFGFVVTNT